MRQARYTYPGAFHHVISRGCGDVFAVAADRRVFLAILGERVRLMRIRLAAWSLASDGYELVLENSAGRMSEFLKGLNAAFAIRYRARHGGGGRVFRDRFSSVLIQDEPHLRLAILHVAQRAPRRLPTAASWSSLAEFLSEKGPGVTDVPFVSALWGGRENLRRALTAPAGAGLPSFPTTFGRIAGHKGAPPAARLERREAPPGFASREAVMRHFAARHGLDGPLPLKTRAGRRLRADLLLELREECGLTYRDIARLPEFADLSPASLGKIYQDARRRRGDRRG